MDNQQGVEMAPKVEEGMNRQGRYYVVEFHELINHCLHASISAPDCRYCLSYGTIISIAIIICIAVMRVYTWPHSPAWSTECKSNDENIGNHEYIGTSILRIYRRYIWIYRRYIGGYFGKKYWCLKLLKTHENVKKTS